MNRMERPVSRENEEGGQSQFDGLISGAFQQLTSLAKSLQEITNSCRDQWYQKFIDASRTYFETVVKGNLRTLCHVIDFVLDEPMDADVEEKQNPTEVIHDAEVMERGLDQLVEDILTDATTANRSGHRTNMVGKGEKKMAERDHRGS